jgi:hypothetical protein
MADNQQQSRPPHQQHQNRPQQQNTTQQGSTQPPLVTPIEPTDTVGVIWKSPAAIFREAFVDSLFAVIDNKQKLVDAKRALHTVVEELTAEQKAELLQQITPMTRRISDIATALTTEVPALMVKLQPGE